MHIHKQIIKGGGNSSEHYLTIRLRARDFCEVTVDEADGLINYRLIDIESESFNCFSRILTKFTSNIDFQLFLDALLKVVYSRASFFQQFQLFKFV